MAHRKALISVTRYLPSYSEYQLETVSQCNVICLRPACSTANWRALLSRNYRPRINDDFFAEHRRGQFSLNPQPWAIKNYPLT